MSIPDRLWRVVKGHWALAQERTAGGKYHEDDLADMRVRDRLAELEAQTSAYEELAEALRTRPVAAPTVGTVSNPPAATPNRAAPGLQPGLGIDPLQASYELLEVQGGAPLETIEAAYRARLSEINPEGYAAGSPQRAAMESRKHALEAAYERIRDSMNPTETRFERLEF